MNRFGNRFGVSIFGESHAEVVGVVIDGVPAGLLVDSLDFAYDLSRRSSGAIGTTTRRENDTPNIISGVFEHRATGAPMTIVFKNENSNSKDYENLKSHFRPSHADYVANIKFGGYNDYRGSGHFSGRLTLGLVAAGVIAKKILSEQYIYISSRIVSIGKCSDSSLFEQEIRRTINNKDSVGAVAECRVDGLKAGFGEPFFDSVESVISHLVFSIPSIKGIEFGSGFMGATTNGSQNNDAIISGNGETLTNNSGGINGGISNGNPIIFRVAIKPTSSIIQEQNSYDFAKKSIEKLAISGRHDACIALRVPPVLEAAAAIALCNLIDYSRITE